MTYKLPHNLDRKVSKVSVKWYCSYFIGSSKWQTTEIFEPDECDTEFTTEENEEDWKASECCAICPRCGALLEEQEMGVLIE